MHRILRTLAVMAALVSTTAFAAEDWLAQSNANAQPMLDTLARYAPEAAASLGANRFQTFVHVILPTILPALLTGFALSLARAIGEYGPVVFISGNMPMRTEITSLLIISKLEQYDTAGAAAISVVMLIASFGLLLAINLLQHLVGRRYQGAV